MESEHVSENLHSWVCFLLLNVNAKFIRFSFQIDLVFGFKQTGQAAEDAMNVFFHMTYAGNVDLDAIEDPELRKVRLWNTHALFVCA